VDRKVQMKKLDAVTVAVVCVPYAVVSLEAVAVAADTMSAYW